MGREALPCIVCRTALLNVDEGSTNQPSDGLDFSTEGHYGSTVFDPFDASELRISVCDKCLVKAGEEGLVLAGRSRQQVFLEGVVIGWDYVEQTWVPWSKGLADDGRKYVADWDELEHLQSRSDTLISGGRVKFAEQVRDQEAAG